MSKFKTENVENDVAEVETLKKFKNNLKEEISKLQTIISNLEAQKHSCEIQKEQADKISDGDKFNKFAAEETKLESKRIEVEKRIDYSETIDRKIADREIEISKREQTMLNLEDKIADLNKQRVNFEAHKTSVYKELDAANVKIAEANASMEKIESDKQMLVAREKKIIGQEKWWNDVIGKLEIDKKLFEIEKENILGLISVKKEELVNV